MSSTLFTTYHSPVGRLVLSGDREVLTGLSYGSADPGGQWDDGRFATERAQLDEYFAGGRTEFDFPLRLEGGPFERRVWEQLRAVPYGTTASYGEIAMRLGAPQRARAVGAANGRNPIAIVVPCHRVIGADGGLVGYGGGLENKRALLELEGALLALGGGD
jgi:methylated-DNA-[protein]-cysteine S-methyltransferase